MTPTESIDVLGIPALIVESWIDRMSEPHRHYHTMEHITAMLEHLDDRDPKDLIAAVWLHDIIYDPRATDNEARSSNFAIQELRVDRGINERRVGLMILRTKRHEAGDKLQNRLNDLDLMILGSSPKEYDRYAEQIRQEYAHVPEEQYRPARAAFMRTFLERERIYQNPLLAGREVQARANIAHEIAHLEQQP